MSWHSQVVISFDCNDKMSLRQIARGMVANLVESHRFLIAMWEFYSSGQLVTYGSEHNHVNIDDFVADLSPFFVRLYERGVVKDYKIISIMFQEEQSENVVLYRISWNGVSLRKQEFKIPDAGASVF